MCNVAVEEKVIINKNKTSRAMRTNMGTNAFPKGKPALERKAHENTCI